MNLDDQSFLRELGERLRQRRLVRKWTQADLAQRCDLHLTFIGSVERGERNISLLNLRLVARVLRISLDDLFDDLK